MEDVSWSRFTSTGRVEDYLRYRGENDRLTDSRLEDKCTDTAGEEAVWEKPLQ